MDIENVREFSSRNIPHEETTAPIQLPPPTIPKKTIQEALGDAGKSVAKGSLNFVKGVGKELLGLGRLALAAIASIASLALFLLKIPVIIIAFCLMPYEELLILDEESSKPRKFLMSKAETLAKTAVEDFRDGLKNFEAMGG